MAKTLTNTKLLLKAKDDYIAFLEKEILRVAAFAHPFPFMAAEQATAAEGVAHRASIATLTPLSQEELNDESLSFRVSSPVKKLFEAAEDAYLSDILGTVDTLAAIDSLCLMVEEGNYPEYTEVDCPICHNTVKITCDPNNHHMTGKCATPGCLDWME